MNVIVKAETLPNLSGCAEDNSKFKTYTRAPTTWRTATGLATLRRDGFTYLRASDPVAPGTMTTKALAPADRPWRLTLNVSYLLPWRDWIEVEVVDAESRKPLAGFSRDDFQPVMKDGFDAPAVWKEQPTLAPGGESPVRLRFLPVRRSAAVFLHAELGQLATDWVPISSRE